MNKNKLVLMLFSIGIAFSMSTKVSASSNIQRIWGNDRYATAIEVSKNGWTDSSEYAVLANGKNFPDALSAAPLAKKYNAPILLNPGATLDSRVEDELKRLGVKQIFIIGGSAVVPDTVKDKLEDLNIKTTRLWGQNRYETSIKVAEQLDFNGQVAVANGENFPDALSIAPIAAQKSMPVILTPPNTLPDATAKYIKDNNITKTYIIGESDVIGDSIANIFPNSERIWGSSKYDTNVAVLNKFKNDLDLSNIYLANGGNFPDALAGSALAAKNSTGVLLVDENAGQESKDFVTSNITSVCKTNILGGNSVISDKLIKDVFTPVGNANGNLCLFGMAAKQGEWIYSADAHKGLYKSKENGSSVVKLSDQVQPTYINVVGDWVYFSTESSIYKVKTDGSSETKIVDAPYAKMIVIGDIIYYSSAPNQDGLWHLYKINTDGSGKTVITEKENMLSLNIVGDWAYYINGADDFKIYKMKIDGSNITKIKDEPAAYMTIYNDYIYYSYSSAIYKTKLDGSETDIVINNSDLSYEFFNVSNNWIYYPSNGSRNLCKVRTDGSGNVKIIDGSTLKTESEEDCIMSQPNVLGNWIYYTCDFYGTNDHSVRQYRAKIDGSENTTVDFTKYNKTN